MMRSAALVSILLLPALLGLAAPSAALPTPGLFCDLSEPVTGRVFPEAMQTNDFVSYEEARCGLAYLEQTYPDTISVEVVGESVGWQNVLTQQKEPHEVFVVHVTNGKSTIPVEDKIRLLFMLSIHGNEKGGREGGLRLIEDFANPDLGAVEDSYRGMLDYMELLFLFPNPDGWTHEEAEYRWTDACYTSGTCGLAPGVDGGPGEPGAETQSFVRVNGNGVDLNREAPTVGWYNEPYTSLSEPESQSSVAWMMNLTNLKLASDIHGMLNPADGQTPDCEEPSVDEVSSCSHPTNFRGHFILTMLPAGRQDLQEQGATGVLAENLKQNLNNDPYFAEWHTAPTTSAWGGEFNDWGSVWDTLAYTDSGFNSDFFAQDRGLNVPGVDFEMAYNHITFDNYYPGAAQKMNDYHVQSVRNIIRTFMDFAAKDYTVTVDQKGVTAAFLWSPVVVTNDGKPELLDGWAAENPADDPFDLGNFTYRATINDYFLDLKPFLVNGGASGTLDALNGTDVTADRLSQYKALIVAGSSYRAIENDTAAKAAIKTFVENGGTLFATDEALKLLQAVGVVAPGSIAVREVYAGHTNIDFTLGHPITEGLRPLARQTYEPVPLGYSIRDGGHSPSWFVDMTKANFAGAAIGTATTADPTQVNLGEATLGNGKVYFLGAMLPDASQEFYHPYGVESYATTYTANLLLRQSLGWELTATETPVDPNALGKEPASPAPAGEPGSGVPAPGLVAAVLGLAAVALALRRRAA